VLSGAGSSQVAGEGGPALAVPVSGEGLLATMQYYHRSSPLKAMRARAPQTEFIYRDGRYLTDAVEAAKKADVAIVFATQWMTEGFDVPDLNLPSGQDALIDAVAAANPHTIVVLETGGPVLMPWLDKTAGVLEAWYPGARGGEAIARVLYGDVNPSGHLPGTFPAGLNQLPRPVLPGSDTVEPNRRGIGAPGQTLEVDYDVEGSNIGYRWFAATGEKPLFPFGYGLSYTSFSYGALQIDGSKLTASFTVTNSGKRAGSDVAQLYLINAAGQRTQRLVGFQRVDLAAGESTKVTFNIDPRLVANWNGGGWTVKAGTYQFALGQSATDLSAPVTASLVSATLKP
jgi:beta-glucosidase